MSPIKQLTLAIACVLSLSLAYAQTQTVSGVVSATSGESVIGAGVLVEGTTTGVTTDIDGKYTIEVPADGALVISSIGYKTVTVKVDGRTKIDVTLQNDNQLLEEAVAVGYGNQRKITLTGSVTSATGNDLVKNSSANLSQGLAGRVAGVIVNNRSGEPGNDDAVMYIRGRSTLGDNSPLIIIDGIPGRGDQFSRMTGDEIESVTVLKDASAAIYGARSANGVILVTTKRGKKSDAPTVQFTYDLGLQQPTQMIQMADAVQFAEAYNAANAIAGQPAQYKDFEVEAYRTGSDPVRYPNTDWWEELIKPVSAQHRFGVSLNGGNDRVTYFVSANGQMQDGIYHKSATKYNQVNIRSNVDVQITHNFKIGFDISARQEHKNYSSFPGKDYGIFYQTLRAFPTATAYYPNGLLRWGSNPVALVQDITGYDKTKINTINTTITAKWDLDFITKGLSVEGHVAYDFINNNRKQWQTPWEGYDYNEVTQEYDKKVYTEWAYPSLTQTAKGWNTLTMNAILNYNRQFGDHNVSAMAGFEQSSEKYEYFTAGRTKYESTAIDQLFAGSADQAYWKNSGSASETARRSYFARIGYDYKSKYMVQFIGRYDGSENFAKDKRWGFFPSVSAGWRISEEGFMDGADWLTNLKIRGSYGEQGNDRISPFQYMTTYDYKTGVYYQQQLGGASVSTIVPGTIANPNVTWEVAKTWNVGIDGSVKGQMLTWEIEYFKTRRSNILCERNATIPIYTGMTNLPEENLGIVENQGFEMQLGHGGRSKSGDFTYNLAGNFMFAKNKVVFMDETPQPEGYEYLYLTGHPMGSSLYYQCIGINRTEEDLKNYPQMAGSGLGDYIYEDIDGNKKIDAKDMLRSDLNTIPQIVFGLTGNFQYKNFDLAVLFQGQARARFHYTPLQAPLEGNITEEMATQSWTLDRQDAKYGRINSTNNRKESTIWLRNASFLRLKNVELGYNFSGKVLKGAGIKGLRLYIGGYNLFTISGLKELDPETNNTATYPLMRVFNTGVKVTF